MPKKKGTRFNTHLVEEIERVCNQVFPCKVQSRGYDIHKEGHHTVAIIVGKMLNPSYSPDHENKELRKNKKFVPDVRIIHIPGGMTEESLMAKIQNIKTSMPDAEMRSLPEDLPKIDPRYDAGEVPEVEDEFLREDQPSLAETKSVKQHDAELASVEKEAKDEDAVLDAIGNLTDLVTDMDDRLKTVEGSKIKSGTKKSKHKTQTSKKKSAAK